MPLENRNRIVALPLGACRVAWSLTGSRAILNSGCLDYVYRRGIATATMLLRRSSHAPPRLPSSSIHNARRGWDARRGLDMLMTFVTALFYTTVQRDGFTSIAADAAISRALPDGDRPRRPTSWPCRRASRIIFVGRGWYGRLFGDFLALLMSRLSRWDRGNESKPDIDNVASSFRTCLITAGTLAPFAHSHDRPSECVCSSYSLHQQRARFFLFSAVRRMRRRGGLLHDRIAMGPFGVSFFSENPGAAALFGGELSSPRGFSDFGELGRSRMVLPMASPQRLKTSAKSYR